MLKLNPESIRSKTRFREDRIRKIVIESLPRSFDLKKKNRIADAIIGSKKDIEILQFRNKLKKIGPGIIRQRYEELSEFRALIRKLDRLGSRSRNVADVVSDAIQQTGISEEHMNLALETLEVAAKLAKSDPPKAQTVKRLPSEKAVFDLEIGRILIKQGVNRRRAARIIALIRDEFPGIAAYVEPAETVTDACSYKDVDTESSAIQNRLFKARV